MISLHVELLGKITQVMHESANLSYEEMTCRFDYFDEDGDWSVESEFSFIRQGELHRVRLNDYTGNVYRLVHQLHEQMKSQTGGDWRSLVLSVDKEGKAHTKYTYQSYE